MEPIFIVGAFLDMFLGKRRGEKIVFGRDDFEGAGDSKLSTSDAMARVRGDHPELMKDLDRKEQEQLFGIIRENGHKNGTTVDELGKNLSDSYRSAPMSESGRLDKREIRKIARAYLPSWAKKKFFGSEDF